MKCDCYHAEKNWLGKIGICWGTKEMEPCSCQGDESKCDFYPEKRNKKMNHDLSKLKIKNIESITIYDADGNELLKLEPILETRFNGITPTFGDAIESLEKKIQLPKTLPAWGKSQKEIAKALKEIVWRFKEEKNK